MNTSTNTTSTIFETASQFKFRYPYKGMITTEDLWDLTPTQLDTIYKALNKEVKVVEEDSLMTAQTTTDGELSTKIEIVKHIFRAKQQAAELNRMAVENAAKKQRILEVLAKKQDDSLLNMSEDDLKKMLDDLG